MSLAWYVNPNDEAERANGLIQRFMSSLIHDEYVPLILNGVEDKHAQPKRLTEFEAENCAGRFDEAEFAQLTLATTSVRTIPSWMKDFGPVSQPVPPHMAARIDSASGIAVLTEFLAGSNNKNAFGNIVWADVEVQAFAAALFESSSSVKALIVRLPLPLNRISNAYAVQKSGNELLIRRREQ